MSAYSDLLTLPMSELERTAIQALVDHGSQNAAALALGWKRTKVQSRLRSVQARHRAAQKTPELPPVHGHVPAPKANLVAHKPGAKVARYILTAAQNNTPVHGDFLANLEAYAEHVGARIMVARFTYNKAAYAGPAEKVARGSHDLAGLWFDPAIEQYVCDDPERHGSCRWELAPGEAGLMWCAEQNILPTAVRPLSGLESYSGPPSAIFPHAKIAMESVPVIGDRPPKFLYTTGAVTQRNYLQRKAGIRAEFHHAYGALLVEVDLQTGDWWARQLNADDDGSFYDLTRHVANGEVTDGHSLLAFVPGDIHASEICPLAAECLWGAREASGDLGVIDLLRPRYQLWHDTHSHRNRSHHETKSYSKRLAKWVEGPSADTVEAEIGATAALLRRAHRPWCTTVIVPSNHDEHLERWLEECDHRADLPNAEFFLEAELARTRAIKAGRPWNALQWAVVERPEYPVDAFAAGAADPLLSVLWLRRDESFRLGPGGHEVELNSHGDLGPDGARGTTANLARVPVRMIKGHSHVAAIRDGVTSTAVCTRRLGYARGPSSWSITHAALYQNGKRALLTMRAGKLWLDK